MKISKENKIFLHKLSIIAIPIVMQEFINSAINITDTFMISSLGETSIAAVGLANQIFFLFILFTFGINSGASIYMGQYWGARDIKSIHKTLGFSMILSLTVASIFACLAFFFPHFLISFYSNDEAVIALSVQYLKIACFTYILSAFSTTVNVALKSTGKTVFPMTTTFIAFLVNVVLNYIFIFKLNLGVRGAATGTLIARTIEIIAQVIFIKKNKLAILGPFKNYFSIDFKFIREYVKKALPVFLNEAFWALGTTQYIIAYGIVGTNAQASIQLANSVKQLFLVISIGIGSSSGIILGNLLGANKIEKAKKYAKKYIITVLFVSLFMGIMLMVISPIIVNQFRVNESVKIDTKYILMILGFMLPIITFNYLSIVGILRSGGDTLFCMLIDAGAVWLVGVPLSYLGAYMGLPIYLVALCSYSEEIVKFIFSAIRVKQQKWVQNITNL